MATGIPASKLKGMGHSTVQSVQTDSEVRLCYEGKRSEQEILATPPAEITRLWQGEAATQNLNRLYYGDNLPILAALLRDPVVCGQMRLVYIRPGAPAGRHADPFADAAIIQAVSAAGAILARTSRNEADSEPRKYKDTRLFSLSPGVFVLGNALRLTRSQLPTAATPEYGSTRHRGSVAAWGQREAEQPYTIGGT
ncbi:MAG: hypothetical protein FJ011_21515 [Chloroflexi bacterium]|nr:hypothetical protein [Chloroflexota bacterium]